MSWTYQGELFTDEQAVGFESFVYIITNLTDGRRYVGKKILLKKVTKKPLKGKTRKRRSKAKSDWETYWGSSNELQEDVARLGEANFDREVVRLCRTRGEANYHEARIQFVEDVLMKPDQWYNASIMVRVHRSHVLKRK